MPTDRLRPQLVQRLLPTGVPRLWCPPLTHYDASGQLDAVRIRAHLSWLAPEVGGWLVPGSTGDGWELSDEESRRLLELVLEIALHSGTRLLIGVLRRDAAAACDFIASTIAWLRKRTGESDPIDAMVASHVCGFTVCPPTGPHLSQDEIRRALQSVLDLHLPVALYQLPQVTGNEIEPATVAALVRQYPHLWLLKDTSGQDRVATSDEDLDTVYLVRGAEGHCQRWLKLAGGPYDGLLLSSANVFGRQLGQMIEALGREDTARAETIMRPVHEVVGRVFERVGSLSVGNPFTNANKAIDHFMAFGPDADRCPPPRLHAGCSLDPDILTYTGDLLRKHDLLPAKGYLDTGGTPGLGGC